MTLAHELAHIFCGHLGGCEGITRAEKDESGWTDRRGMRVPEKEIEAEATAYLVAARAGLATRSADYLRIHASKEDMSRVDIDLVVRAAARIERLGDIGHGEMRFEARTSGSIVQ